MGWADRLDKEKPVEQKPKRGRPARQQNDLFTPKITNGFLQDWEECRDRHEGQKQVLSAFFEEKCQYIILRAGRKFAKTTTNIDIAWRFGMENQNAVIYYCCPTITQAIEILWDEKRLQWCDLKSDWMKSRYITKTDDSKHMIWFTSGSYIKLIGTWSEARGRGTQPDLLIVDEMQDCSSDYLDAVDPNLAAKNGFCVMTGTPPKKRNHFHIWEDRVSKNPRGKIFHFTSYANEKIPHLKGWLDNKKLELIDSGKEDVWNREYMAVDCFSSADRVLPDPVFVDPYTLMQSLMKFSYQDRFPVVGIAVETHYLCSMFAIVIPQKFIYILDKKSFTHIWNKSFVEIYPELTKNLKELQDLCTKKMQFYVSDDSKSFKDVILGFSECKKDDKWQDRGIPLLREMMLNKKILISDKVEDFGPECQNILREESRKDVQQNYPHICALAMLVNEFFQMEKIKAALPHKFDPIQALVEAGIVVQPKASDKTLQIFRIGD